MKKVSSKKIENKGNIGKQLKISSFFSVGKNDGMCSTSINDECNKQSKISTYFFGSENKVKLLNNGAENNRICNNIVNQLNENKLVEEIDLTEDQTIINKIKIKETVFHVEDRSPSVAVANNTYNLNKNNEMSHVKLSEKENSPVKYGDNNSNNFYTQIKVDSSPDIIMPTPPKNVKDTKKHNKGVKRKFDFLNFNVSSKKHVKPSEQNTAYLNSKKDDFNSQLGEKDTIVKYRNQSVESYFNIEKDKIKKCNISFNEMQISQKSSDFTKYKPEQTILNQDVVDHISNDDDVTYNSLNNKVSNEIKNCISLQNVNENIHNDILFDDWDHSDDVSISRRDVNLDKYTRCKVISVRYFDNGKQMEICLSDVVTSKTTKCILQGSWAGMVLREGDTVSIQAEWNEMLGWIVTDTSGCVVLEPDILVAGTTLVGSLFCMRRAILTDMFHGLESNSEVMIIGSLLHEILQEALKKKLRKEEEIKKIICDIISTHNFIFTLYSSDISMSSVKKQLDIFIPQIIKFISNYISPVTETSNEDCWKGAIIAIEDIEENIWSTNLGLKGRIDVTVKVSSEDKTKIMPLELKTGRASFSSEHRGQVIVYSLMMSELGKEVDSGLLLYLREGVIKEVKAGAMEKRDLILLRNEFVRSSSERQEIGNINDGLIGIPNLPEPINHLRGCSTCPYLTLCSAALKETGVEKISPKNPLNGLLVPATEHLKSEHIRFVFHWVGLLQLEEKEIKKDMFSIKDIWNLTPEEREKNGSGLCNLKLENKTVEEHKGKFSHTFFRDKEFTAGVISKGTYLIVSTDKRVAIASGIVSDVTRNSCTIELERDLSIYKNINLHVDNYESQNQLVFNMTNLGHLLEGAPECGWLRDKIISMELPVYSRLSSEVLSVGQDILSKLNKGQKHAVLQALASQHYLLIKGMPGTGKTATLVSLIELLVRLGQSLIITSHTHSAVDNVLKRLSSNISILRLGPLSRIHPDVQMHSEHHITASTPEELEGIFNSKQVVGVTCLGSGHPLLHKKKFNLVLVDEATQVLLPTTLRPLFAASRFILVGDPMQLPPLVKSRRARDLGLHQSLFSYLDRPTVTAELRTQYRMNKCITDLANGLTYEGKLECANDIVARSTITITKVQENWPDWMTKVLSTTLEHSVVVLDTGFVSQAWSSNNRESKYTLKLIKTFLKVGLAEHQLGVIAPFKAQVALLKNAFQTENINVEVSTIDTFQGRDKDVIIYSCTRSSHANETGLLSDHNRLTVAVTRAKHKMIFIGDVQTLKSYPVFLKLFSLINSSCIIKLPEESI
ncbi:DNA replication helicase/nuclease 2 [Lycorma delicatula]|uniref:DNA replication helicase/nuclease 2 n=1 Tax=Lycorma delicatula TaxID=130591 RepID=UPI003F51988C